MINADEYYSPYKKVLENKVFYTRDIEKQINIYTLDYSSGPIVIGSMSYRSGNASDVDLFEKVFKGSKTGLIKLFVEGIKRIVQKLQRDPRQYFLEVKLGMNTLFNLHIGICRNDKYDMDSQFFDNVNVLYENKLITPEEFEVIQNIHKKPYKNQLDYEIVKLLMRKRAILRWSYDEIMIGYKILKNIRGEYRKTIENAVQDKGQINIEGLFINDDNKIVDCSNFFVLEYIGDDGVKHLLNLSDEALYDAFNFRDDNLKQSTYTLMYSILQPNLFKAVKRLLSYGKMKKDTILISKVYPLINSQLGNLYQATSQLKTVNKLLTEHGPKKIFYENIYHTLESIGFKLQELIFIDFDIKQIIELIEIVLSNKAEIKESELIEQLNDITHDLIEYINRKTKIEMMKVNLYPLPNYLTPENKPF